MEASWSVEDDLAAQVLGPVKFSVFLRCDMGLAIAGWYVGGAIDVAATLGHRES